MNLESDGSKDASSLPGEQVVLFQGPLLEAKQMRDACVDAEIPALLDRAACCGSAGCGCGPKLQVLVAREDLPRAARLAADRWRALAIREGTLADDHPLMAEEAASGLELETSACPACGETGPIVEGACNGCGLQLE